MARGTKTKSLDERLQAVIAAYRDNPESVGYHLRLNLSTIVCTLLSQRRWTQRKLADAAKMKESFVSRIINAESNCTFDVAGRILFALGVREGDVELRHSPIIGNTGQSRSDSTPINLIGIGSGDSGHGKETIQKKVAHSGSKEVYGQEIRIAYA